MASHLRRQKSEIRNAYTVAEGKVLERDNLER
jgi:hypothetical protein